MKAGVQRQPPRGYQPEAGEWIGDPGQRIDSGRVSGSGRWWSDRWWAGHHMSRNACGQFGEPGTACRRLGGHRGRHDFVPLPAGHPLLQPRKPVTAGAGSPRKGTESQRLAAEYRAYLEARHDQAERATRGAMLTPQARARGTNPRRWFSGRTSSARGQSEELRDWFRQHGPNLTATQFRYQQGAHRGAAAAWFGHAA